MSDPSRPLGTLRPAPGQARAYALCEGALSVLRYWLRDDYADAAAAEISR
jgi:hypothetical protein